VVIDVGEHVETLVRMFACHRSQVYEWLPYNMWQEDQLPEGEEARLAWLDCWYRDHLRVMADRYRASLLRLMAMSVGRRSSILKSMRSASMRLRWTSRHYEDCFGFCRKSNRKE